LRALPIQIRQSTIGRHTFRAISALEETNLMQLRSCFPRPVVALLLAAGAAILFAPSTTFASEADLVLPDLRDPGITFFGLTGHTLLTIGLAVAALGILFGLVIYVQLKRLPVHRSMAEVSDLIYETCKTYLQTQGKFILILWVFIAAVMVFYFGFLRAEHADPAPTSPPRSPAAWARPRRTSPPPPRPARRCGSTRPPSKSR
jgi:hypothetical protein